jgi:hypothetical protein
MENAIAALTLSHSDVAKLHEMFQLVENNQHGLIDLNEFMDFLKIESTKFRKRAFAMFDEDSSREVDFREFVLSIWNYCTLSRSSLGMEVLINCKKYLILILIYKRIFFYYYSVAFVFDLYDQNITNELSTHDIRHILFESYGKEVCRNNYIPKQ